MSVSACAGSLFDPNDAAPPVGLPPEAALRAQVWGILSALYPQARPTDRRREERFPYPRLIYLTPVEPDGATRRGETIVAAGKHLSERGIGFYHPSPLAHRLMITTLEKVRDEWLSFLLDVSWCRFSRHGWYESGGRFLRSVPFRAELLQ